MTSVSKIYDQFILPLPCPRQDIKLYTRSVRLDSQNIIVHQVLKPKFFSAYYLSVDKLYIYLKIYLKITRFYLIFYKRTFKKN